LRSGASLGIAMFGTDSADAEALLSHADLALYRAKSDGRGTYRFFTEAMDTEVRTRVLVDAELRNAIVSPGQLFLAYQPQVDVDTGRIIGLEALIRWRHPTRGIVLPGEFIPIAERSGLIVALGHWVMREACRQMREWLDAGIAPPLIAVNLSALQFKTPLELERDIEAVLAETGVPPQRLEFELTESVLMDASRERGDVLLRLRRAGFRIAIDDFGTGYSSLEYLRRFPVDRIKIAQQFMVDLTEASGNAAILRAAIALGHALRIDVLVEGVETAEQLDLVKSLGSHEVQGYYFSRPLPAGAITALLESGAILPLCKASVDEQLARLGEVAARMAGEAAPIDQEAAA
jgi:EAL domain-containing protein (putative c-di-GMP-specific phosphodiesterase class I)